MAPRRPRTPVPPVEPTDDVAPLVEDPAPTAAPEPTDADTAAAIAALASAGPTTEPAAAALTEAAAVLGIDVDVVVEVAPEPPTRFVIAEHTDLGARATLARSALADWPGWEVVEDVPDGELPSLPAHTED